MLLTGKQLELYTDEEIDLLSHIEQIKDNPNFCDRYTVVLDEDTSGYQYCFLLSDHCGSPQGVSILTECMYGIDEESGESEISYFDLPDNVQKHLINRLREFYKEI